MSSVSNKKKKKREQASDDEVAIIEEEDLDSKAEKSVPKNDASKAGDDSLLKSSDCLTEQKCEELLTFLHHKYTKHVDSCKADGVDFKTHGWPRVLKAVRAVRRQIEPNFVPKSITDVQTFGPEHIDPVAQLYLQYCKTLRDKTTEVFAIRTRKNGNCFSHAVSIGLNGHDQSYSQETEIRLRASLYYAEHCDEVFALGNQVGWAKGTSGNWLHSNLQSLLGICITLQTPLHVF